MKTVTVTELKTHCLRLLREVEHGGPAVAITRRGKTIAFIHPPEREGFDPTPGRCPASFVGDVLSPLDEASAVDLTWS